MARRKRERKTFVLCARAGLRQQGSVILHRLTARVNSCPDTRLHACGILDTRCPQPGRLCHTILALCRVLFARGVFPQPLSRPDTHSRPKSLLATEIVGTCREGQVCLLPRHRVNSLTQHVCSICLRDVSAARFQVLVDSIVSRRCAQHDRGYRGWNCGVRIFARLTSYLLGEPARMGLSSESVAGRI
jgi:hypothetical protein